MNFKINFFSKVASVFILTVATTVLLMNFAFDPHIDRMLEKALYEESQVIIDSMDISLSHLISNNEGSELQDLLQNLGDYERIDNIIIIDKNYDIKYSSDSREIGKHVESEFLRQVVENKKEKSIESDIENEIYLVATPIHNTPNLTYSDKYSYFICLAMDVDFISKSFRVLTHNIHIISVIIGILFILLTISMLYRFIQNPLLKFTSAAEKISKNEYDTRVEINSNDEWELLSKSFNKMAQNIEETNRTLLLDINKAENENSLKSEFLANMSHEIRTPLNTILGFSEILYEDELDDKKKESLKIVNTSGKYLLALINDILDFSRINSDKIVLESTSFIVEDLVKDIYNMFSLKVQEKNLNFIYNISPMVPQALLGDSYRLKQIIINLISNSIKFTNHGTISFDLNYTDETLVIMVTDTGIGIPPENRQKIFNMFEQSSIDTTRLYGGSGLGLAIVKQLVELMNGHILLFSEVNKGTKITIRLKLKEGSLEDISREIDHENFLNHWLSKNPEMRYQLFNSIREISTKTDELREYLELRDLANSIVTNNFILRIGSNYSMTEIETISAKIDILLNNKDIQWTTVSFLSDNLKFLLQEITEKVTSIDIDKGEKIPNILIAEDVLENRLLMEKYMEYVDSKISFAENGKQTVENLINNTYDILLLDIQMPIMNGLEVLKYIRDHDMKGTMKIFILTADTQKENIQKYFSLGADGYLSKPISKKKIIELINGTD